MNLPNHTHVCENVNWNELEASDKLIKFVTKGVIAADDSEADVLHDVEIHGFVDSNGEMIITNKIVRLKGLEDG